MPFFMSSPHGLMYALVDESTNVGNGKHKFKKFLPLLLGKRIGTFMDTQKDFFADLALVCAQYHHAMDTCREDSIQRSSEMIKYFFEKWSIQNDPQQEDPCDKWRNCGFNIHEVQKGQLTLRCYRSRSYNNILNKTPIEPVLESLTIDTIIFKKRTRIVAFMNGKGNLPSIAFDAESGERLEVTL